MRYVVGFLIGIGLIVLAFILVMRIFGGGGGGGNDKPEAKPIVLNSYANTETVMRLTMDGPTVADAQHQQLKITVGRDQVLYERSQGYKEEVVDTRTYPNNTDSYGQFLRALEVAEFTRGDDKVTKDERGFCPTGRRYVYEVVEGGKSTMRWWNTTCGGTSSFKGKSSEVRRLFIRQVTDYNALTRNTPF